MAFKGTGDMANQIQRASLSISNNIAEGFERGSNAELVQYLYIAKGSTSEVRSMLRIMLLMNAFDEQQTQINRFLSVTEDISRQLGGWVNSLKNSKIKGQKYLNDKTRHDYELDQRRRKAIEKLDESKRQLEAKLKAEAERRCRDT